MTNRNYHDIVVKSVHLERGLNTAKKGRQQQIQIFLRVGGNSKCSNCCLPNDKMKQIEKVYIPYNILNETSECLREFGEQQCEGLVLWLGNIDNVQTSHVTKILVPPQDSIKSEDGVGYFVTSETLFSLNKLLSSTGLRLLAQVHSHPGRAYHSSADDRYCIVTAEGGFSIVVPDFGFGPSDLYNWATYRLVKGSWEKLSAREVKTTFIIEEKPDTTDSNKKGISIKI